MGLVMAGLTLAATPIRAQQAPRPLFPGAAPQPPAAAPAVPPPAPLPDRPAALPAVPPSQGIRVEPLAPPTLAALGIASAEAALGGPLWAEGAPPELPLLLQRLPADISDPTLRELQKSLLGAPGPREGGGRELFLLRVDRLLAMAEPQAALDLLALLPEASEGPEVEARRLLARFAADQVEPACAAAKAQQSAAWPWPEARLVCAAQGRDAGAVDVGLDLLEARGQPVDPAFATLLRAEAAGEERVALAPPVPDDPLLLPLLRRAPLDLDPARIAAMPVPVRRALAVNPNLPSAVRAAAGGPARPGPSVRPELNGRPPADWAAALASVPAGRRAAWTALADGLGLDLPDPVWAELYRTSPPDTAAAPGLALWRGFEVARAKEQRGAMLAYVLLLLDGRPEAAAPIALRRALDALDSLHLKPAAVALASGTGGALGL
jgi:hypothetical protein